jgi:hypothetical protein
MATRWAVAGWEYAYIAEGMDNHAQYQMKFAFRNGRVKIMSRGGGLVIMSEEALLIYRCYYVYLI